MRHEPFSRSLRVPETALALFLFAFAGLAQAAPWPNDGRLVARGSDAHSVENAGGATVCTNGAGGAIVAYKVGDDSAFIQSQSVGDGPEPWDQTKPRTISNDCPASSARRWSRLRTGCRHCSVRAPKGCRSFS